MEQQAETIGRLQTSRPRCFQEPGFQRDINEIGNDRARREQAHIELERRLSVHAERSRVDQKVGARKHLTDVVPRNRPHGGSELIRECLRSLGGPVRQMHAFDAALEKTEYDRARRTAGP